MSLKSSFEDELVKLELDSQHFRHLATTLQQKLTESQSREKQLQDQLANRRPEPEGAPSSDPQLARLKSRLVEVEEEYTRDLLASQQTNDELARRVEQLERQLERSRSLATHSETQSRLVASLEERVQQHSTSVANLQLVIEQIQKENARKVQFLEAKFALELETERARTHDALETLRTREQQMRETAEALGAASRLSDSIDAKEDLIAALRSEAHKKDKTIERLEQQVIELKTLCDSKVDKQVIKGLVIGYFLAPNDRKPDVQRLLARILDFDAQEMDRTGIRIGKQKDDSFSHKFVQFLESESKVDRVDKQLAKDLSKSLVMSSAANPFLSSTSESLRRSSSNNILIDSVPVFIPQLK